MKPEAKQNQMLTAGKVLRARRLELGKSVEQISVETKIQPKYIQQLENDEYENFESEVFMNGFIKIYASHMSLNVDKVLALYRRGSGKENPSKNKTNKKEDSRNKKKSNRKDKISQLATPKNIIVIVLTLIVFSVLIYLVIQFYNFQKQPVLEVYEPTNNTVVDTDEVTVKGSSEKNTTVEINGEPIILDENSDFEVIIKLTEGNNAVNIRAIKDNNKSQETSLTLNIRYEPKEDIDQVPPTSDEPIPEADPIKYTFRLEIVDSPAWILLTIDDKQEFAQILNAGFTEEFEITKSIFISTGKPTTTKVYINEEEKQLNINFDSGTATLECNIEDNELRCL
jgi:cytoskeletal protein RodZ